MTDLLPCPFCKLQAGLFVQEIVDGNDVTTAAYVKCDACEAQGPECRAVADAEAMWNKAPQPLSDAQGSGMPWERAETASVDANAFYLVKDNGGEWRDFDLHIMRGTMVNHKLAPQYVRGRPEWIAKVNAPAVSSTESK